jgi:hypothetical protein
MKLASLMNTATSTLGIVLMTDHPANCIKFCSPPTEEVLRLDKEGFHYRGQFIADAGEAHRLMVEFLRQNTKPEPQMPTDEELDAFIDGFFLEDDWFYIPEMERNLAHAVLARWGTANNTINQED